MGLKWTPKVLNGVFHETLLALDDEERTFSYSIDDGPEAVSKENVQGYIGEVRVFPVTDDDSTGRFKQGDLLLICQGDRKDPPSQLVLLELGKRRTLAWRTGDGRWKSAFTGRAVSTKAKTVGHCLGVIWAHF